MRNGKGELDRYSILLSIRCLERKITVYRYIFAKQFTPTTIPATDGPNLIT